MYGRLPQWFWLFFCLLLTTGCGDVPPPPAEAPVAADAASDFDAATAGTIEGRVTWDGDLPHVAPIATWVHPFDPDGGKEIVRENPNAPAVDPPTRGVANAVVYLRGINPKQGRPWDHAPVRVEQRDYHFEVFQGETGSRTGFVRRGEAVEMVSRQKEFHALHAGGAAFFTLTFPEPNQPRSRCMEGRGLVELSSEAGYFWMRAYLFVDDHPYYSRTDREGRFILKQVPPGRYQVVCWLPNWHKERQERNPDTFWMMRWQFRAPVERVQSATLGAGETRQVPFSVSAEAFAGERPAGRVARDPGHER